MGQEIVSLQRVGSGVLPWNVSHVVPLSPATVECVHVIGQVAFKNLPQCVVAWAESNVL